MPPAPPTSSSIKQLTLGLTQYAQDADESFPQWKRGQNYLNAPGDPNNATTLRTNAIYPFVKSAAVYHCPDDSNTSVAASWGPSAQRPVVRRQ